LSSLCIGIKLACFTPVLRDVHSALKRGRNTLIVKVDSCEPGAVYPNGLDPVKTKYIPGFFIPWKILTGTPTVSNIQPVPEIDKQRVHVLLRKPHS